ncbi:hypothetical protein IEQ34_026519 [Dendrobium chrysotoxum]|uniref:Alpha/beta hydrolase fold-3 domain-containing protein n=1 Tax=Dendrobium chrysotoxum TaxID=161865 RepID=A0AAV7FM43_DENCH|nr:hypothetical protein IEQ34_026519 [Dendrobium chrysotoxum]
MRSEGAIYRFSGVAWLVRGRSKPLCPIRPPAPPPASTSRPSATSIPRKVPALLTIHGGGFCLIRSLSSIYHNYINSLTAKAGILSVSVDYRLTPENPLLGAHDDSWEALDGMPPTTMRVGREGKDKIGNKGVESGKGNNWRWRTLLHCGCFRGRRGLMTYGSIRWWRAGGWFSEFRRRA